MKSKVIYTALILLTAGLLAWGVVAFINKQKLEGLEQVVQSVCLTSGYSHWYDARKNPDGSWTVRCFNYDWDTVNFEW